MIKKHSLILGSLILLICIGFVTFQVLADVSAVNKLQITITNVRLVDIGLTSCDLFVTVTLTNPTNRDLSLASARFNVFIAESYIGNSSISRFSIPKTTSTEQLITLTLKYSDLAQAVLHGIKNKNFDLYLSGEAQGYAFYGLLLITVPFSITSTYS